MTKEKKGLTEDEIRDAVGKAEKFGISQKLVIFDEKEKKFLLLLNAEINKWELPGGIVDKEESLEDALAREIQEEVGGVKYDSEKIIGRISTTYKAFGKGHPVIIVGYLAFYQGGEVYLGNEHLEFKWLTPEEIENDGNHQEYVKQFIRSAVAKMKSEEYLNDLKRLQADFENYKKRQAESQKELGGFLIEKLLFDIIPVLDNFRMATSHVPEAEKDSPWVTGIGYIEKQLEDALAGHGVSVMEVKEGDVFDPSLHDAVSHESQDTSHEEEAEPSDEKQGISDTKEVIAKVLQNGYKIGGRVVRAAKVTVKSS